MNSGDNADHTACLIRMITLIVGACAAVLALVAVTIYARKALKEALVVRIHTLGSQKKMSYEYSCSSFFIACLLLFLLYHTFPLLVYEV